MTTAVTYNKISEVPKMPKIKVTGAKAPRVVFTIMDSTPQWIDLMTHDVVYTDAQFYADLSKASNKLDAMESKALEEHAQGKTRKFPTS